MVNKDYYRAQAEFCAELAASVKRPDYQERWLRRAQEWRDLAEQMEKEAGEAAPLH